MARKSHHDALGVAGAETIIGTGVEVSGNLTSESDLTIDGNLIGNISAAGNVLIGVNAVIKGNVRAGNVTVAGNLTGNIIATDEAAILSTGNVVGDITSNGLAIDSGAIFTGQSRMKSPVNPQATAETRAEPLPHSDKS